MGIADTAGRRILPPVPRVVVAGPPRDAAQQFVVGLRASASDLAAAAGATSAVVREAVPPARHRRARCRLVLRLPDGADIDVVLVGPAGPADAVARHRFGRLIRQWLAAGRPRGADWLLPDPGAPEGVVVDLESWRATV